MEIINEILKDYEEYCKKKLISEFGSCDFNEFDPIYTYQRFKCRIIDNRPRSIIEPENFQVPFIYQDAYTQIKNDILVGAPLKKYQSRNLKKLDYDDDMLSHWKIQHFHLGRKMALDGFMERTGDLLFIYFNNNKAYIVGFFSHSSWCDLDIIEIIHKNWPFILSKIEKDSNQPENTRKALTEAEIKILRKKRYTNSVIVQDGTEYFAPGFGVTSNGAPIDAQLNSMRVINMFNHRFENIKNNIDYILKSDPDMRRSSVLTIGMEMDGVSNKFIYQIKETGFKFTLNI